MRLKKPCEHGRYDPHFGLRWEGFTPKTDCPGGEFLGDDDVEPIAEAIMQGILLGDSREAHARRVLDALTVREGAR